MASVTLTAAMRANLLSLQSTASLLGQTQLRLSTGNKVNSALDNPVNFFAAQTLNNRASDLGALLDGMGQGVQALTATTQGIDSLTTLVNQLKSTANSAKSALSSATTTHTSLATVGMDSDDLFDLTAAGDVGANIAAGDSFSIQHGSDSPVTFTINTVANGGVGVTANSLVAAINAVDGLAASLVDGATVGERYLKVVSTDGLALNFTNIVNTPMAAFGIADSTLVSSYSAATYTNSYADIITQVNQTVADSGYQGINLLDGTSSDLTVQVNEKSTNPITVANVDLDSSGLALASTATGGWATSSNVDTDIALIDAALVTLRTTASSFANGLSLLQNRQDFTQNIINTLKDGASALTIADKNEEGANMLALQTAQQLGIQSLALASQANQSVLRLFQ